MIEEGFNKYFIDLIMNCSEPIDKSGWNEGIRAFEVNGFNIFSFDKGSFDIIEYFAFIFEEIDRLASIEDHFSWLAIEYIGNIFTY